MATIVSGLFITEVISCLPRSAILLGLKKYLIYGQTLEKTSRDDNAAPPPAMMSIGELLKAPGVGIVLALYGHAMLLGVAYTAGQSHLLSPDLILQFLNPNISQCAQHSGSPTPSTAATASNLSKSPVSSLESVSLKLSGFSSLSHTSTRNLELVLSFVHVTTCGLSFSWLHHSATSF